MRPLLLLGAWVLITGTADAGGGTRVFEYLHVEANSGASSGGHAAICFADSCFHFQQADGGFVRLVKDFEQRLDHVYRVVENRTIHAYRVEVATEAFDRLDGAFRFHHLVQSRQFETLAALREERAFLEHLLARHDHSSPPPDDSETMRVPGSAYFIADDTTRASDDARPALRPFDTLRAQGERGELWRRSGGFSTIVRRLRRTHGRDCLERRAEALRGELESLGSVEPAAPVLLPVPGKFDRRWIGIAGRHRELLGALLAVDVLRDGLVLRRERVWMTHDADFALGPRESDALRAYRSRLVDALVRLFASQRPDWGFPMLVGLARLETLEASIAAGTLVLLDIFREDAGVIEADVVARHRSAFVELGRERREDFEQARRAFFDERFIDESGWSRVETAANLALEIDRALADGTSIRVHDGHPIPLKSATRRAWPAPRMSRRTLERTLVAIGDAERRYAAALQRHYGYNVVFKNCVTEIFRTIDAALAQRDPDPRLASRRLLGGHVAVDGTMNFIPFVSARTVAREYAADVEERPSYRRLALARLSARANRVLVWLRESNVLTSRVYERDPADTFFLFFTEESRPLRPVRGLANLAAAGGATAAGLVLLPFDRGRTLRTAARGIVFSLPELVFVNVRKGSFPFAPRSWLAPGGRARTPREG